jgi:CRP-like cAMP-binding protein
MENVISMTTKMDLLRKQPCFSKLHDEEIEILASLLTEKIIKANETIVTEGEIVDSVYLILKGTAQVSHLVYEGDKTDKPVTIYLATMGPSEAIGLNETGFYSLSGRRSATVTSETEMVLLRLSVAAFHGFALAYSHVSDVMKKGARDILGF